MVVDIDCLADHLACLLQIDGTLGQQLVFQGAVDPARAFW